MEIGLTCAEGVATIRLLAAQRRNALTIEMADELIETCDQVDDDLSIGAAVVEGDGEAFCSGAHRSLLAEVANDPSSDDSFIGLTRIYEAFVRVGRLKVPTVAAVIGAAVGAGVNLALSTDLRVMADNSVLKAGFITLGIHPGGGHFTLAERLGGREAAAGMGLFGGEITGPEALRRGIAWEVVPPDAVSGRAHELARTAARDPDLSRRAVRSFRLELGPPPLSWEAAVQMEHSVQMWSLKRSGLIAEARRAAGAKGRS